MVTSQSRILELPGIDTDVSVRAAIAGLGYEVRPVRASTPPERYTYYDTWNTALRRKGYRFRRLHRARRWELLEGARQLAHATDGTRKGRSDGKLARRLLELCGAPASVPFIVATETSLPLRLIGSSGSTVAVTLRSLVIESPFKEGETRRRALLHLPDDPAAAGGLEALLRQRIGAKDGEPDLFELAVASLGLFLPGTPPPRRHQVRPGDSLSSAASRIVARQTLRLRSEAPGASGDYDPEFVHDMRVAARTLRHALKLFRSALPSSEAARAREELTWLAGCLGAVRDQDVFLGLLERGLSSLGAEQAPAEALLEGVRAGRVAALEELRAALGSQRYATLVAGLENLSALLQRPSRRSNPAREAITRSMRAELAHIRARRRRPAASFTTEELHDLRIHFRRLRYTCELVWPLFGKEMRRLGARISAYQARLGDHRDAWVSIAAIRSLAGETARAGEPGRAPELLEALAAQEESTLVASRSAFGRLWEDYPELERKLERSLG